MASTRESLIDRGLASQGEDVLHFDFILYGWLLGQEQSPW